mmetsp:Transcript_28142/g.43999  ORF Transcript_28142/g.43999 Transcript_28142/m.43999 type:complete len:242 (+) Transcript_28142:42-767(+)
MNSMLAHALAFFALAFASSARRVQSSIAQWQSSAEVERAPASDESQLLARFLLALPPAASRTGHSNEQRRSQIVSKKKAGGKTMKVRMLKDVKDVGKKDEVIMVNPAFAANMLFPQKYALNLNSELGRTTHQQMVKDKEEADAKYKAEVDAANALKKRILDDFQEDGITIKKKTISLSSDKFTTPIRATEVAQAMDRVMHMKTDPKVIHVPKMKRLGAGWVKFELHKEVDCEVKLKVVREG